MSVRVIAGKAKGRRLKMVPGDSTRPIMDRVKEALFSILGRDVVDTAFLDLFAGTGSVGIEALSRGAAFVLFVDLDRMAIKTIHENLELTKFTEQAVVRRLDAFDLLRAAPDRPYDYIFIAPPQYKGLWRKALETLDANPVWVSPKTVVIVQVDPEEFETLAWKHLSPYDERRYGKTQLVFYRSHAEDGAPTPEEALGDD